MRKLEVIVVVSVVALVSLLIPYLSADTTNKGTSVWSIEGVSPQSTLEEIEALLGKPKSDSSRDGVRTTVFSGSWGEVKRTEFVKDKSVGISGKFLEKNGRAHMEERYTYGKVIGIMGEPELVRELGEGIKSYQYDGVRIYLDKDQRVTSFVIEGYIP